MQCPNPPSGACSHAADKRSIPSWQSRRELCITNATTKKWSPGLQSRGLHCVHACLHCSQLQQNGLCTPVALTGSCWALQTCFMVTLGCANIDTSHLPRCRALMLEMTQWAWGHAHEIRSPQGLANIAWGMAVLDVLDYSLFRKVRRLPTCLCGLPPPPLGNLSALAVVTPNLCGLFSMFLASCTCAHARQQQSRPADSRCYLDASSVNSGLPTSSACQSGSCIHTHQAGLPDLLVRSPHMLCCRRSVCG